MTEIDYPAPAPAADVPLPLVLSVTKAATQRMPSQRVIDLLNRLEPGRPFGELAVEQPFRIIALRQLMADYPDRDLTSLWMHAYDVEVDIIDVDPTSNGAPMPMPTFAATGVAFPTTSTP
jgi:hypothetical protein